MNFSCQIMKNKVIPFLCFALMLRVSPLSQLFRHTKVYLLMYYEHARAISVISNNLKQVYIL